MLRSVNKMGTMDIVLQWHLFRLFSLLNSNTQVIAITFLRNKEKSQEVVSISIYAVHIGRAPFITYSSHNGMRSTFPSTWTQAEILSGTSNDMKAQKKSTSGTALFVFGFFAPRLSKQRKSAELDRHNKNPSVPAAFLPFDHRSIVFWHHRKTRSHTCMDFNNNTRWFFFCRTIHISYSS